MLARVIVDLIGRVWFVPRNHNWPKTDPRMRIEILSSKVHSFPPNKLQNTCIEFPLYIFCLGKSIYYTMGGKGMNFGSRTHRTLYLLYTYIKCKYSEN